MSIMTFTHRDRIADPLGDLEQAYTLHGKQAGKGVSRRVRRDPRHSAGFHVPSPGKPEIVSVAGFAVRNIGHEHEGLSSPVFFQKGLKGTGEGNRPRLSVFGPEGRRFFYGNKSSVQVEPIGPGLADFVAPHASVEGAEENEFHPFIRALSDDRIPDCLGSEKLPGRLISLSELHLGNRVIESQALFHAPREESLQGSKVGVATVLRHSEAQLPVKSFHVVNGHLGGGTVVDVLAKLLENALGPFRGARAVLIQADLVGQELANFFRKALRCLEVIVLANFLCTVKRFPRFLGLKRNVTALTIHLKCQPVNVAAKVNASANFCHAGLLQSLSHFGNFKWNQIVTYRGETV